MNLMLIDIQTDSLGFAPNFFTPPWLRTVSGWWTNEIHKEIHQKIMNRFSPFTELTENTYSYFAPPQKRPNLNGRRPIPMAPPYIQRLQRAGLAPDTPGQQWWGHRHRGYFPTSLCGVLVFDSVSRLLLRRLRRLHPPSLTHTIFHTSLSHTHFVTHHFVTHHLFNTHHLSHTTLLPTIFHTQCYPPSFTHNFVTHPLCHTPLCHTPSLSHTTLSHTIFHTHHLSHTPSFTHTIFHTHHLSHTPSFTHTIFHAHHLSHTPSFTHHLSHTFGVAGAGDAAALCVAGMALGDIHLRFTW